MSLLGERLRQAREARGISPLQVEIDTRIRANVIQALEEGDYDSLPPEPFLHGLIRSYANYLAVDAQEILDLHSADQTPATLSSERKSPPPIKPTAPPAPPVPGPIKPPAPIAPPIQKIATTPIAELPPAEPPKSAPPPLPPETLLPPEHVEHNETAAAAPSALPFFAHITRRGLPFPVLVLVGIAIILSCLAATLVAITQVGPAVLSLTNIGRSPTPARAPATRTPTLNPGAAPTSVPTFAVTAAPFATFPGNPTATLPPSARRTPEATAGLNLSVDVTQTITIQVGIDGALVFNAQMQPGQSNAWTAKNSLYVHVVNPRGATLAFNGNTKWFGAKNYAERTVMERQWDLNDKGVIVNVAPVAPAAAPAATPASPSVPPANLTPTPTLTPFS